MVSATGLVGNNYQILKHSNLLLAIYPGLLNDIMEIIIAVLHCLHEKCVRVRYRYRTIFVHHDIAMATNLRSIIQYRNIA